MDHFLETAAQLLPHLAPGAKARGDASSRSVLEELRTALDKAFGEVCRRREEAARAFRDAKVARYEEEDEKKKEPPETARAAPGILELELLADLLARTPSIIPAALTAVGKPRFYPTFLAYLMQSIEEFVKPPRLRLWKRFAASEHVSLIQDRRRRVAEILMTTVSWTLVESGELRGSSGSKTDGPAADGGVF